MQHDFAPIGLLLASMLDVVRASFLLGSSKSPPNPIQICCMFIPYALAEIIIVVDNHRFVEEESTFVVQKTPYHPLIAACLGLDPNSCAAPCSPISVLNTYQSAWNTWPTLASSHLPRSTGVKHRI